MAEYPTEEPSNASSWINSVAVGLGMAIILVGAPLSWILRDMVRGGKSPVFLAALLLLGAALMANLAALRRGRLYATRCELGVVLAPILIISALAVVPIAWGSVNAVDIRQLIDNAVLMALIFAGLSQPLSAYRYAHRVVAVLGIFVAAASLLYAVSSLENIESFMLRGRFGGFGEENAPFLIAKVGILTIAAAWIWFRENNKMRFVRAVMLAGAAVTALPMFLLARSRTNTIGAGIAIFAAVMLTLIRRRFYPAKGRRHKPGLTRSEIAFFSVTAIGGAAIWNSVAEKLGSLVTTLFGFLGKGGVSMFGGGGNAFSVDPSAAIRREYLAHALDTFQLTGHGYKAVFVDNPVLGAFCDLGLIGGTGYALVAVLIPLKICLDLGLRGSLPPFVKFSVIYYLIQIPVLFLSVTPYIYINWQFIILFYVIAGRYWSSARFPQPTLGRGYRLSRMGV